ncbi:hypothetical protein [Ottowia thiooxydans]|uniref:hypothetical protein n=1 Tax=Ottowia thiooxydans TaxID=219182 RepID=UPI001FDF08A2|nr:hypothetical protein [Ottowia thiooxydans]
MMKRLIRFFQYLVLVLSVPLVAQAQAVFENIPRPAAAPQNALSVASQNVGVKTCRPALERLSALAVNGTRGNDVLLDWDRQRVDAGPVFSLIGLEYANGGAAMSVTAVPGLNGGCSVSAERISSAPFSCQAVAQQELKGMTATRLLPTFTVFTDAKDPTATVSLIDAPPGCLVIRRYVEFNWKAPR